MHQYHFEEGNRKSIYLIISIVSILLAYLLYIFVFMHIYIPWWVETPSILGIFGFLIWIYKIFLWNKFPFSYLSFTKIPDLNGEWKVIIESSFDNFQNTNGKAYIKQNAYSMNICLETKNSKSFSEFIEIRNGNDNQSFDIIYTYINKPKSKAKSTMEIHTGTVHLTTNIHLTNLDGYYYSGRGRKNFGDIHFIKDLV
jgi:hypothetical protein